LRGFQSSVALPGITFNTGPAGFHPIKQLRLVQFDGTALQPIGDGIESAKPENLAHIIATMLSLIWMGTPPASATISGRDSSRQIA
jgi:hypothetical protein